MNKMTAVFTNPDTAMPNVFWGAFATTPDAHTAVEKFIAENKFWSFEDFTIEELPFGVLL